VTPFGHPRRHLRATDSTNERARELAAAGAPGGTVVTAREQSEGRGRRGRTWSAPPGKALLCSAILAPLELRHSLLPLAVPIAVCEAVESLAPIECRVKWPNDVWAPIGPWTDDADDGSLRGDADAQWGKLAGVLIEAQPPAWAVIGIGLNVSVESNELPDDLRRPAASIGHGVEPDQALAAVCERLEAWADAPFERLRPEFARRDALAGLPIRWEGAGGPGGSGSGVADGIDERGNLCVVTADGERLALGAGEVQLS
jgi:BirA family transcriptional regulator, biotin operon repressor / biotin---[acetyl-CoA-carboxylase] ligase